MLDLAIWQFSAKTKLIKDGCIDITENNLGGSANSKPPKNSFFCTNEICIFFKQTKLQDIKFIFMNIEFSIKQILTWQISMVQFFHCQNNIDVFDCPVQNRFYVTRKKSDIFQKSREAASEET